MLAEQKLQEDVYEVVEYAKPIIPYEENTEDELNKLLELGFGEVVVEVNNNQVPLLPGAVAESVHTNYIAAEENLKAAAEKLDTIASAGIYELSQESQDTEVQTQEIEVAEEKVRHSTFTCSTVNFKLFYSSTVTSATLTLSRTKRSTSTSKCK